MRTRFFSYSTLLAVCFASSAWGAVAANPTKVNLKTLTDAINITLTNDGKPLTAKDIHGWKLESNGFNYSGLVDVKNNDGVLQLIPTSLMAVGSYVLRIETENGTVAVPIYAPLSEDPDLVKQRTSVIDAATNKVLTHYKTSKLPNADLPLEVLPTYYEGQTLVLNLPLVDGASYTWFVNGVVVAEGVSTNQLTYSFNEAGFYAITCVESQNVNGETVISKQASAQTRVVPYPGVVYTASLNVPAHLPGPIGYEYYAWRVDGADVSNAPNLDYTFTTLGTHTVECNATTPSATTTDKFVRVAYNVTVVP